MLRLKGLRMYAKIFLCLFFSKLIASEWNA
jgi:hypothetical protein